MKINNSADKKESNFREIVYRLSKNKLAIISFFFLIFVILFALFAPLLAPYDYATQNYSNVFRDPSSQHLLGTDNLGRDILSRLIYGSRQSLEMAIFSVALSATLGIIIGTFAGYRGGIVDNLLMRFLDIYQSIPVLIMAIALAAALGPGIMNTIFALSVTVCPFFARMMRASIMTVRNKEYIEASIGINASDKNIIFRHILPNAFAPMIVVITMSFGSSMLIASTLSFIGLGAQPPSPEWGAMLTVARQYLRNYPLLITYPGICIMLCVLSFNLLGDGLRDALDPRLKN